MTKEESEVEQLRSEVNQLRWERKEWDEERVELQAAISDAEQLLIKKSKEWEDEKKELQKVIKNSVHVEDVVRSEYTQEYFPRAFLFLLSLVDKKGRFTTLYTKWMSLFNYMFVCGIGVFINMYVLLSFSNFMTLWLANIVAIFTAFLFNWTFSVGPLGYLFGLSPKIKVEKRT